MERGGGRGRAGGGRRGRGGRKGSDRNPVERVVTGDAAPRMGEEEGAIRQQGDNVRARPVEERGQRMPDERWALDEEEGS